MMFEIFLFHGAPTAQSRRGVTVFTLRNSASLRLCVEIPLRTRDHDRCGTTLTSPGLLDQITSVLDVALSGRGFPRGERADAGDALVRRWTRDHTWKRDIVDVVYRRGRTHLTIGVSVEVPAAGRYVPVDGTNVGYLAGAPIEYPLPRGWFRTWKLGRLLNRIDRETRVAVDWFDEYDSPRQTLQKLHSPERNGCRIGSDPHREIVTYLESLGDAYPSRRELIDAFARDVPLVFGPLAARHGLTLRQIEPRLFVLESEKVRVRVRFGSGHEPDVHVLLGPTSDRAPGYDDRDPDIIGLPFEPQKVSTPHDVRRVIEIGAQVLERDYSAILHATSRSSRD